MSVRREGKSRPQAYSSLSELLQVVDANYLRPSLEEVREAEQRADRLVFELHRGAAWMFRVLNVHSHGSLSRGTALRHFKDLDRLVELDPEALRTRGGTDRTASDTIRRMAQHITRRRAGLVSLGAIAVRAQEHSVGIEYAGGIRIDLVPALRQEASFYIPEQGTGDWIPTDPQATAGRLQHAKMVAPHTDLAVRLLKGWSRARGRNAPIPSFAVETWVVNQVLGEPLSLPDLVVAFFSEVGAANARVRLALSPANDIRAAVVLVEPVSGNNLTQELRRSHRSALIRACRDALADFDSIAEELAVGRPGLALNAAKRLFVGNRWALDRR